MVAADPTDRSDPAAVSIRAAGKADFQFFLSVRNERDNIRWTGHVAAPDPAALDAWFTTTLARADRTIFIVEEAGNPVGYLYQDRAREGGFEVAIGISETAAGRGVATRSLGLLVARIRHSQADADIGAWVFDHNLPSLKVFTRNCFATSAAVREVTLAIEDGRLPMHRLVYDHPPDLEIGGFFATIPQAGTPPEASVLATLAKQEPTWFGDGRQGILAILQALPEERKRRCLLPAYICASVVQPFIQLGLKIAYYAHNAPLAPSLPEVGEGDLVLIDDAFGVLAVSEAHLRDLVAAGAHVILDVTHSLFAPERLYPQEGVTMVASLRKSLPVPDGGMVMGETIPGDPGPAAPTPNMTLAMAAKAAYLIGKGDEGTRKSFLAAYRDHEKIKDLETITITGPPTDLLAILAALDLRAIISRRQTNLDFLEGELAGSGLLLFPRGTSASPFTLPLVFPDTATRDATKAALICAGIYPPIHWLLPSPPSFTYEHSLSARVLSLPLDQRYHPGDLVRAVRVLEGIRS